MPKICKFPSGVFLHLNRIEAKTPNTDELTSKKGQENEQPEFGLREVMYNSYVVF